MYLYKVHFEGRPTSPSFSVDGLRMDIEGVLQN